MMDEQKAAEWQEKFIAELEALAHSAGEYDPQIALCLFTLVGVLHEGEAVLTAFSELCGAFVEQRMEQRRREGPPHDYD